KLLNEEFEWNKDLLEDASPTSGPAERITEEEVRVALAKTKVGKAAGPTGLVSEMLTASGETGVSWLTDLFNAIVKEGRIPADWKKSWMISVYKGKGDALEGVLRLAHKRRDIAFRFQQTNCTYHRALSGD